MPVCRRVSVAAALLLVALPAIPLAQVPTSPVVVADSVTGDDGSQVTFTLRNSTGLAVTAWGVTISYTRNDGQAMNSLRRYSDAYLVVERPVASTLATSIVPPYGEHSATQHFGPTDKPAPGTPASVVVDFVIFEDGTAVGNESSIARVFQRRASDARVYSRVSEALRQAGEGASGQAALDRAQSLLRFLGEDLSGDARADNTRHSVSTALERIKTGHMKTSEADGILRSLLDNATADAQAAAKHAVRRY